MPDFNYGDFTQQGIENKVTIKARLNERRYVTLDLQSDVEGPNLTISGNVHDELNNIDYPIGSAPNGNIEITENGENINVAPYATATVNVSGGGGDFKTLHIIATNTGNAAVPPVGMVLNNNGVLIGVPDLIDTGKTVEYDCLITYDPDDGYFVFLEGNNIAMENYVGTNCEVVSEEPTSRFITIPDIDVQASVTLDLKPAVE